MLTRILIAGRSAAALQAIEGHLKGALGMQSHLHLITNGHADPMYGVTFSPDVVLFRVEAGHTAELTAWAARPAAGKPPLIVIGQAGDADSMRLAIRSGARDFLPEPVNAKELLAAIEHLKVQDSERGGADRASVHVFVSAAGGAGSSLIAANVAHLLAAHAHRRTALVDLDLNFAPIAHHLNLQPQRGLVNALEAVGSLDEHALTGYAAEHSSGLRLYCSTSKTAVLSKDVHPEKLSAFISLLAGSHQHVVLDAPHAIDGLTATAFGLATDITIVLQQSTLHIRNATRLIRILREELMVPAERIRLLVNRHNKKSVLQLEDIGNALSREVFATVPSHYQSALESSDAGIPLYEADRTSPISRALVDIVERMTGTKTERPGLLQRALPSFMRN